MPLFRLFLAFAVALFFGGCAQAQEVGHASADFTNARFNRVETPFGRLVADALQSATNSDCAILNAGALRSGTLEAGPVEKDDLVALLSFAEDNVVTLEISGAQLRAALERAVCIYPTGSPAFLHCSGLKAVFDPRAPSGQRLVSLQVKGSDVDDKTNYQVAMPVSLAEGAAGYFNIWNGAKSQSAGTSLIAALDSYIGSRKEIAPSEEPRLGPSE